jgi:hypothetical protein
MTKKSKRQLNQLYFWRPFKWTGIASGAVVATAAVLLLLARGISDDPCLNDWDIACTTASRYIQAIDTIGLLLFVIGRVLVSLFVLASVVLIVEMLITDSKNRYVRKRKQ